MKNKLNKSDFRKIVYSDDAKVRKEFKSNFLSEIDIFIEAIFNVYRSWEMIDKKCKGDKQKSYVVGYLFNGINNLAESFQLLISGHLDASGNLCRQFMESSAMAILLSSKELEYFDNLMKCIKEKRKFPFHRSLNFVSDNIDKLKGSKDSWDQFKGIRNFYHSYSHPSLLSLGNRFNFTSKDVIWIGGNYDPAKKEFYAKEIFSRINAANFLKNIIEGIMHKSSVFV